MAAQPPSHPVAVTVRLEGRSPYAMFELVALTTRDARLRGPLLLELGEKLALRFSRDGRTVDVDGTVATIERDGGTAVTVVDLDEATGAQLAPLLPK